MTPGIPPGLSSRQQQALEYISRSLLDGRPPTLDAVAAAIGLRSRGHAHRIVQDVIDRGYLRRDPDGPGRAGPSTTPCCAPSIPRSAPLPTSLPASPPTRSAPNSPADRRRTMAEDTAILTDLAHTAAFDALRLIVGRGQLLDDAGSQLCVIVGAIAMLAGTVRGAILDQDVCETRSLWTAMHDAAHAKPMMSAVITPMPMAKGAR